MAQLSGQSAPTYTGAWAPIVLSLDGGGVRGLSSLYILQELMKHIKEYDNAVAHERRIETDPMPLPCNYFDFIIGTSTGGLIAVMLGRLRMQVSDCIKQYWLLSIKIFRPPRTRIIPLIQTYSSKTLQVATKDVVKRFCLCHTPPSGNCQGEEDLRQYDYGEFGEALEPRSINKTCRVAIVTVREGGRINSRETYPNVLVLLRSYNHRRRLYDNEVNAIELNPKGLESSRLRIHEACSATTAAPTYFRKMKVKGRNFIDGGVMANNPSMLAWNEATQMATDPTGNTPIFPNMVVSVGCGRKKEISGSSIKSLLRLGLKKITDTTAAHESLLTMAHNNRKAYYRFDVPEITVNSLQKGLANIKLDQCQKTKRSSEGNTLDPMERRENELLQQEASGMDERRRDSYKPAKYHYKTFDKLHVRTLSYCKETAAESIRRCAQILYEYQVSRKASESRRWHEFRTHPNPNYRAVAIATNGA